MTEQAKAGEPTGRPAVKDPPGYRMLEYVGGGAMGDVYRALHLKLDRVVAIKTTRMESMRDLRVNPARLIAEAKTIAKLSHPNIVTCHDFFEFDGNVFIVMEFLDGLTVADILSHRADGKIGGEPYRSMVNHRGIKADWTAKIGLEVARALDYAHRKGIYHRDIKPSNIFVSRLGEVKLFDFSIARDTGTGNMTATGVIIGTPPYMSPEQIKNSPIDGRSDLYSLGCVLYECLAGAAPFQDTSEIMVCMKHLNLPPPDLTEIAPEVPAELIAAIYRCLEKEPPGRHASGQELEQDLSPLTGDLQILPVQRVSGSSTSIPVMEFTGGAYSPAPEPVSAPPPGPVARPSQGIGLLVGAAVVLLLGTGALFLLARDSRPGPTPPRAPSSTGSSPAIAAGTITAPTTTTSATPTAPEATPALPVDRLTPLDAWFDAALRERAYAPLPSPELRTAPGSKIVLSISNPHRQPIEVSFMILEGLAMAVTLDARRNWALMNRDGDLEGRTGGRAFGGPMLRVAPGGSLEVPLAVPGDGILLSSRVSLADIRLAGRLLLEEGALATDFGDSAEIRRKSPARTNGLRNGPLLTDLSPTARSQRDAIVRQVEPLLAAAAPAPLPAPLDTLLAIPAPRAAAETFLALYNETLRHAIDGRQAPISLLDVEGVSYDPINESLVVTLRSVAGARPMALDFFIVRGSQPITLTDGTNEQEVRRPLRGIAAMNVAIAPAKPDERLTVTIPSPVFAPGAERGDWRVVTAGDPEIELMLLSAAYTDKPRPDGDDASEPIFKVVIPRKGSAR